nr:kinesin-like protein KIN-5C [Tanacetum cinerariifolium]
MTDIQSPFLASNDSFVWRDLFVEDGFGSTGVAADGLLNFWRGIVETIVSAMSSTMSCVGVPIDARLASIKETAAGSKQVLDRHVSSFHRITVDAEKWQGYSSQAENDVKESTDFAAAKHSRFELLLQKCVDATESALSHSKKIYNSVIEMERKHVMALDFLLRKDPRAWW